MPQSPRKIQSVFGLFLAAMLFWIQGNSAVAVCLEPECTSCACGEMQCCLQQAPDAEPLPVSTPVPTRILSELSLPVLFLAVATVEFPEANSAFQSADTSPHFFPLPLHQRICQYLI